MENTKVKSADNFNIPSSKQLNKNADIGLYYTNQTNKVKNRDQTIKVYLKI